MSNEYKKLKDGSFVHNCLIIRKDDDKTPSLFHQNGDESVSAFLNGYAIIPLEEYFDLKNERGEEGNDWPTEMLKNMEEADKWLFPDK